MFKCRQYFTTATFKNDAGLQTQMFDIYAAELKAITGSLTNSTGFSSTMGFEPITKSMTSYYKRRGGNALGLSPADGPLMRKPPLATYIETHTNSLCLLSRSRYWNMVQRSGRRAYPRRS